MISGTLLLTRYFADAEAVDGSYATWHAAKTRAAAAAFY